MKFLKTHWMDGGPLNHAFYEDAKIGTAYVAACGRRVVIEGERGRHDCCKACERVIAAAARRDAEQT